MAWASPAWNRAKASRATLAALSISSTPMNCSRRVRRRSAVANPKPNSRRATTRYPWRPPWRIASMPVIVGSSQVPFCQRHSADHRGKQHQARHLEAQQVIREEGGADLLQGHGLGHLGPLYRQGLQATGAQHQLHGTKSQGCDQDHGKPALDGMGNLGLLLLMAVQHHDHEKDEHHDRAGVDDDLEG